MRFAEVFRNISSERFVVLSIVPFLKEIVRADVIVRQRFARE